MKAVNSLDFMGNCMKSNELKLYEFEQGPCQKKDVRKWKLVKKSSKAQQNTIDGWEEH